MTVEKKSPNSSFVSDEEVQACISDLEEAARHWILGSIDQTGLRQEIARIEGSYPRLFRGTPWDSEAFESSPRSVYSGSTCNQGHEPGSAPSRSTATQGMESSVLWQPLGSYPLPSTTEKKERPGPPEPHLPSIPEEPEPPSGPSSPKSGRARTPLEDELTDIEIDDVSDTDPGQNPPRFRTLR